jgi:hypothetical protein
MVYNPLYTLPTLLPATNVMSLSHEPCDDTT